MLGGGSLWHLHTSLLPMVFPEVLQVLIFPLSCEVDLFPSQLKCFPERKDSSEYLFDGFRRLSQRGHHHYQKYSLPTAIEVGSLLVCESKASGDIFVHLSLQTCPCSQPLTLPCRQVESSFKTYPGKLSNFHCY